MTVNACNQDTSKPTLPYEQWGWQEILSEAPSGNHIMLETGNEPARNGVALNLRGELLENCPYGEESVTCLTCIGWSTECHDCPPPTGEGKA